jgi:hypothetical protein
MRKSIQINYEERICSVVMTTSAGKRKNEQMPCYWHSKLIDFLSGRKGCSTGYFLDYKNTKQNSVVTETI